MLFFIKICEVCGAIQTINDTEKRIQMHLEGKIHQGFLRLRTEIDTLRIRLEFVQQAVDKEKEKNKPPAIAPDPTQQPTEVKHPAPVKHEDHEKEK